MQAVSVGTSPSYQDIYQFLDVQRRERYRAFLLHDRALQKKTQFAKTLCASYQGGLYVDVLQFVLSRPDLAAHLDLVDVPMLQDIVFSLVEESHASLLMLDELDFLLNTWTEDLISFKHMVEFLYFPYLPTCVGFVLQTRPAFEEWRPLNTQGLCRVFTLADILAL
jgi:hypothetical protein